MGRVKMRLVAVAMLALLLAACDNADDANEPSPRDEADAGSAPAQGQVGRETRLTRVPFLTLRNRTGSDKPARAFGDERDVIRAGYCEVTWTPIKALDVISKNAPLYIPSEDLDTAAALEQEMQTFWNEFRTDDSGKRPLLYIHGYNIGFEKGCHRASRFIENLEHRARVILFSWPSDGEALNYTRDEADLVWSVHALRQTLTRMEVLFGRGNFDVFAHSLGARGAAQALSSLLDFVGHADPLVDQLVLVAADIDAAIFQQLMPRLSRQARHITAYVSDSDSALALSREVHGYPRLGEAGDHLVGLSGVELIDVSALPLRRVSGHLYHLYNEAAVSDIRQLLIERLEAAQRSGPVRADPTLPNLWRIPADEK